MKRGDRGRYSRCRQCIADWQMERTRPFREVVDAAKAQPCADCGGRFPLECMDFDHRDPEQKLLNVSYLINLRDMDLLQAEIAKCDVVCANCHRVRTRAQRERRRIQREEGEALWR